MLPREPEEHSWQCSAPEHSDRSLAWTRHRKATHGHHTELFKEAAQSQQEKATYDLLGFKRAFGTVAHQGLMLLVSKSAVEREPQGPEGACLDPQDRAEGPPQLRRAGPCSGKGRSLQQEGCCAQDADSVWTQTLQAPGLQPSFFPLLCPPPEVSQCSVKGLEG